MESSHRTYPTGGCICRVDPKSQAGPAAALKFLLLLIVLLLSPLSTSLAEPAYVQYVSVGVSPGAPFSRPLGIFFDADRGECYVADTGNNRVVICDENGMPIFRFFHHVERDGKRMLGEPRSLVVDSDGRIFLTDASARYVDVLDHRGRSIGRVYPPEDTCEEEERFDLVALAPDGEVAAILSCPKLRVAFIDERLGVSRVVRLQSKGSERPCVTGLSIDTSGKIYITDPLGTDMVQIYDRDGRFVMGFGKHDTGMENFSFPAGIDVTPNGDIWIVDTIRQVASRFTLDGKFLAYIGGKGSAPGAFEYPSDLATDGAGRVFVLERGGNRYQCFRGVGTPEAE